MDFRALRRRCDLSPLELDDGDTHAPATYLVCPEGRVGFGVCRR
jgi:hypothetical protein